jgi:hypothetical protein
VFEQEFGRPGEPAEQTELQTIDAKAMTSEQPERAIAAMVVANGGLAALIRVRPAYAPSRNPGAPQPPPQTTSRHGSPQSGGCSGARFA